MPKPKLRSINLLTSTLIHLLVPGLGHAQTQTAQY